MSLPLSPSPINTGIVADAAKSAVTGGQFNGQVDRISLTDGITIVNFDFNPESVEMSREAKPHDPANVQSANGEAAVRLSGSLILTFNKVQFIGADVEARMNQLLNWAKGSEFTTPAPPSSSEPSLPGAGVTNALGKLSELTQAPQQALADVEAKGTGAQQKAELQVLNLTWGQATQREVIVQRVSIVFNQFSTHGVPLAATASLTLVCQTPKPKKTNPSSGGLPGRAGHTMVAGENLVGLATATYGAPRYWKALAAVNKVDDPLRIAPGRQIYLPSPSEL